MSVALTIEEARKSLAQDEALYLDDANDTVDALVQAEGFIAGFEGDPQQDVADILAGLRAAIQREQAMPSVLAELKALLANELVYSMATGLGDHAKIGRLDAAIAAAEGRR